MCRATSGHGRKLVFDPGLMKSVGQEVREAGARQKEASAGMIGSQAIKTTEKGAHYDTDQKIKARKDHLLVDRLGLIPSLSV